MPGPARTPSPAATDERYPGTRTPQSPLTTSPSTTNSRDLRRRRRLRRRRGSGSSAGAPPPWFEGRGSHAGSPPSPTLGSHRGRFTPTVPPPTRPGAPTTVPATVAPASTLFRGEGVVPGLGMILRRGIYPVHSDLEGGDTEEKTGEPEREGEEVEAPGHSPAFGVALGAYVPHGASARGAGSPVVALPPRALPPLLGGSPRDGCVPSAAMGTASGGEDVSPRGSPSGLAAASDSESDSGASLSSGTWGTGECCCCVCACHRVRSSGSQVSVPQTTLPWHAINERAPKSYLIDCSMLMFVSGNG